MSRSVTLFTLLTLLHTGCDDSADLEVEAAPVDTHDADEAPRPQPGQTDLAERPRLEILVDGQPQPERLIAEVEADPDTTIYFTRGDAEADGHVPVMVTIIGRDGGFDYGGLFTSAQATPLEMYLAVADDDEPVPEALQLAHDREVARSRPGDDSVRDLAAPGRPTAYEPFEGNTPTDLSSYTCLSWSNFQAYMDTRFAGAPFRVDELGSAVGPATLYSPAGGNDVWINSQADMVACNYNSVGNTDDTIDALVCYIPNLGGAQVEHCGHTILHDGYYLRGITEPEAGYRRYRVYVDPLSPSELQSFSFIVKRGFQ